jgi:hypothetical protein
MPFYDLPAKGQAHACARIFFAGMEPLKHLEDTFEVLCLNANPVVLYGEDPIISVGLGRNVDFRGVLIPVLDPVADQILE